MADADQSLVVRKLWLRAVLGAMIALMSGRALAAERPRIAVAIERAGELSLPREFGEEPRGALSPKAFGRRVSKAERCSPGPGGRSARRCGTFPTPRSASTRP